MLRRLFIFLVITFAWSWGCWLAYIGIGLEHPESLRRLIFGVGSMGPAIGGVIAIRLTSVDRNFGISATGFAVGAIFATIAILINYLVFTDPSWVHPGRPDPLDPSGFTHPLGIIFALLAILISGYVFGSWRAPDRTLASYFAGLIPDRRSLGLAIPVILLLPTILLVAHMIERLIGGDPQTPHIFSAPITNWLPTMVFGIISVAALTGGNEEHGWRGVMQPVLQERMSPLLAALVITLFWDVWHMPLHIGGVYGENTDVVAAFVGRLPNTILLSVVMAAIYNYSRGSVFLCILFHACFNTQVYFFSGNSSPMIATLLSVFVALSLVVWLKLWRRSSGYVPEEAERV